MVRCFATPARKRNDGVQVLSSDARAPSIATRGCTLAESEATRTFLRHLAHAEAWTAECAWPEAASLWALVVAANPVEGHFWSKLAEARYHVEEYREAIGAYGHAFTLRDGYPRRPTRSPAVTPACGTPPPPWPGSNERSIWGIAISLMPGPTTIWPSSARAHVSASSPA